MNLVYIAPTKKDFVIKLLKDYFENVTCFDSIDDFQKSDNEFDVAVFSTLLGMEIIESYIKVARQSDKIYVFPIFFEEDGNFLFYETPIAAAKLKEQVIAIKSLCTEIEHHHYSTWENRILAYFYTRPDFTIAPKLDKQKPMFYYYPLVEQFYDGQEDYFYWLEDMASQNILSKVKLVDRIFCCPYCFSALLKFSDHCPNCGSINIRNEKFIHCFTCGYVGPESKFLKNERFVCPSCKSKLKLIGQDYDRPLENGVCNDCGTYHIESKLKIECLTCHKSCSTEDLSKKLIYEYKLTEYGRNQIRFGTINSINLIVNELNYLEINHFIFNIDWYIKIQRRYPEDYFSLIALKFVLDETTSAYDLILEFSKMLRQLFRTTDLCSKLDINSLIFFFPKSDAQALQSIQNKIQTFLKNISLNKGKFDIKIASFSSTKENISDKSAEELIAAIAGQL
ncbi:MAG TPA: hypothetical protein DD381_12605 [Lentisphaeria bacterium]|nr:MAG: hypothetical protein A2X47_12175 [Lentisphaerae bacterium GWF2_38_69]HBM17165.1 hypothetical protein [Lentisphaeria bacterium]